MKILFTGASSFTGFWFVQELAKAGHQVLATFTGEVGAYQGIRRERVDRLLNICEPAFQIRFGENAFLEAVKRESHWDLFCHHAAEVRNYKSQDFNFLEAIENNTKNLPHVLGLLKERGCRKVLLTGSVFEQNEGAGSLPLRPFSPYGFSKGLTSEIFQYYCESFGLKLGKFVIPNPFGPFEEPRFTSYLIQNWRKKEVSVIKTPAYIRDNIHVSLLAKSYLHFATRLMESPGFERFNPSGYPESQKAFAERFSREMEPRLKLRCGLGFEDQKEFPEPPVRINTDLLDANALSWNEPQAWDELAEFYQRTMK